VPQVRRIEGSSLLVGQIAAVSSLRAPCVLGAATPITHQFNRLEALVRLARLLGHGLPVSRCVLFFFDVKTTFIIADPLFARAQRAAKERGITMRELVEQGLRAVLQETPPKRHQVRDMSVGREGGTFPLAGSNWTEVRALSYGESDFE
jgi:hypothetical protein